MLMTLQILGFLGLGFFLLDTENFMKFIPWFFGKLVVFGLLGTFGYFWFLGWIH